MARTTGLMIPLSAVTAYYLLVALALWAVLAAFPDVKDIMPVGAVEHMLVTDDARISSEGEFLDEVVFSSQTSKAANTMATLGIAMIGGIVLMIPVAWIYVLTHERDGSSAGFIWTIVSLPVVIAGIAIIVQHSLPLAFSLAGIAAAIRFRVALRDISHGLYVFAAILVGLAAGIKALEVAAVVSGMFVYTTMILWKLDFGEHLGGRVMSLFAGRDDQD